MGISAGGLPRDQEDQKGLGCEGGRRERIYFFFLFPFMLLLSRLSDRIRIIKDPCPINTGQVKKNLQLIAVDFSACVSMKNVANYDN